MAGKVVVVDGVEMPAGVYRSIAQSAARGAKFLDKKRPGWFKRVKTTKLDMQQSCKCIYGQLNAYDLLEEMHVDEDDPVVDGQYGYIPGVRAREWEDEGSWTENRGVANWYALQEEWLRQIRDRRIAAKEAKAAVTA